MSYVSLSTVPVVLGKRRHKIVINALRDDEGTETYINSDVVAELNLQGETEKVMASMLNDQVDSFEKTPVECELESLDGKSKKKNNTNFTANRVTDSFKPLNWNSMVSKWRHLKKIRFTDVDPKPIVDILIGVDYADLHCAETEYKGEPNEPDARLILLGWTCFVESMNQFC